MFQNIRKQKEHAFKVGYAQGYEERRRELGLPPLPAPDVSRRPARPATPSARRALDAIERFGVADDGVVKIPAETLAVIRFMLPETDDADAGLRRNDG